MLTLFVQVLTLNETRLLYFFFPIVWVRDQEKKFNEKFSQSEIQLYVKSLWRTAGNFKGYRIAVQDSEGVNSLSQQGMGRRSDIWFSKVQ